MVEGFFVFLGIVPSSHPMWWASRRRFENRTYSVNIHVCVYVAILDPHPFGVGGTLPHGYGCKIWCIYIYIQYDIPLPFWFEWHKCAQALAE